ncbi:MAG: hypothetical protein IKS08_00335 [Alphaproteobacteria bacterium]|nr:hypothetical protein [Alphaproteobacteria bacterium]
MKILNSLKGVPLFVVLFAGVVNGANAQTQEPKKQQVVRDTAYVNAMRKPWDAFDAKPAAQIKFGPKPKNPPVYKPKGWIEIPADSIHQPIPSPIVDKKINGVSR